MASTWSALKIELLETGQNSGTWGTLTNVNLGDAVLGEAITGSATVDFPTDADVTITLTDSATSQSARNLRLNITESSTGIGSVRSLILGSGCQIEKFYLINNTGTGAKTVKNTTGTGISVPAGKATLVYNNGTNVVDAASYFTSLTLGSALPVASGGTGLATLTANNVILGNGASAPTFVAPSTSGNVLTSNGTTWSSAAPATSGTVTSVAMTVPSVLSISGSPITSSGTLALTYSGTALPVANGGTGITSFGTGVATALGVNTGSAGAFVVNGGALGSPSSVGTMPAFTLGGTVSGGGNQINNVVIGTSNPLAGAFTTLGATGAFTGTTGTFSAAATDDGVTPIITVINTTVNGYGVLKLQGNARGGILGFYNGATAQAAIEGQANQVGIYAGSDASGTKVASFTSTGLAVTGTLSATDVIKQTGNPSLSAAGATEAFVAHNTGYGAVLYGQGTTYDVALLDRNTTPRLTVTTAGAAVTGTLSATGTITSSVTVNAVLESINTSTSRKYIEMGNTSGNMTIGIDSSTGGSLVVGAAAYSAVVGTGVAKSLHLFTSNTVRLTIDSAGAVTIGGTLSGGTSGTGYSFSGSAPATSLTLNSSGNLGIGTASPNTKLQVNGGAVIGEGTIGAPASGFQLRITGDNTEFYDFGRSSATGYFTSNASQTSPFRGFIWAYGGTAQATLDASGNLGLGVTPSAWNTSSVFYKALQIGTNGSLFALSGSAGATYASAGIGSNMFYDGTDFKAIISDYAARYQQFQGAHQWYLSTGSVSAGNAITFTQAMTLDASGNLGIGTAPSYKLHVVKGSSGITARFTDGDGITDVYGYGLEITRSAAYIKGSGALHLGSAAGYNVLVIDSAGNSTLSGNISVGGATVTTSGTGITFPASDSPSSNANTLDDYEEGIWTPTQGAGLTVVGTFSSNGVYTKIGDVVFIEGIVSSTTSIAFSTNALIIGGLPFSSSTTFSASINGANGTNTATATAVSSATNLYSANSLAATTHYYFSGTYKLA